MQDSCDTSVYLAGEEAFRMTAIVRPLVFSALGVKDYDDDVGGGGDDAD